MRGKGVRVTVAIRDGTRGVMHDVALWVDTVDIVVAQQESFNWGAKAAVVGDVFSN